MIRHLSGTVIVGLTRQGVYTSLCPTATVMKWRATWMGRLIDDYIEECARHSYRSERIVAINWWV